VSYSTPIARFFNPSTSVIHIFQIAVLRHHPQEDKKSLALTLVLTSMMLLSGRMTGSSSWVGIFDGYATSKPQNRWTGSIKSTPSDTWHACAVTKMTRSGGITLVNVGDEMFSHHVKLLAD
jgi:hypothetical protein